MDIQNFSIDSSKKFLITFFILITLLLIGFELFLRDYVTTIPKSVSKRVYDVYYNQSQNVVVGDSHVYRGFIDQDEFVNLGKGGTTIPVMDLLIRNYFKHREPNKVIIEASPQLLSEIHLQWKDKNHKNFFLLNQPWLPKLLMFEPGVTQELAAFKDLKMWSKLINKSWPNEMKKGDYWARMSNKERLIKTKSRVEFQTPLIDSKESEEYLKIYNEMLNFLLAKGADLCMLRTPVDGNYLALIEENLLYQKTIHQFKNIAEKKNIKYIDFRELEMSFGFDEFINQDHLMPHVSNEFSLLVDNACFNN